MAMRNRLFIDDKNKPFNIFALLMLNVLGQ